MAIFICLFDTCTCMNRTTCSLLLTNQHQVWLSLL